MISAPDEMKAPVTPAGTVVAWFPQSSELRRGTDGRVTILSPPGWAVCDGTRGTSDLSDRFIIESLRTGEIGSSGAAATHDDNKTDPSESSALIYIMKL